MQDYMSTDAALRKKAAAQALHMFFSPHRVPIGLTDEEVGICIALFPMREAQRDRHRQRLGDLRAADKPVCVPLDLVPLKAMTRRRFRRGIWKFLEQVAKA